jgi:enoyl-CoA hydratase/carnithine racemase
LVAAVHPDDRLVAAAIELADRLAAHDPAYVRTLTATLRQAAAGDATHADLLTSETEAQAWSLRQPAFLAGLAELRARIARR